METWRHPDGRIEYGLREAQLTPDEPEPIWPIHPLVDDEEATDVFSQFLLDGFK
jgi:hypothetical protein